MYIGKERLRLGGAFFDELTDQCGDFIFLAVSNYGFYAGYLHSSIGGDLRKTTGNDDRAVWILCDRTSDMLAGFSVAFRRNRTRIHYRYVSGLAKGDDLKSVPLEDVGYGFGLVLIDTASECNKGNTDFFGLYHKNLTSKRIRLLYHISIKK